MSKRKKAPEITFQQHIADFLVRVHGYGVLEQTDITDTEHFIAEDHLWAFLKATQADTLKKLEQLCEVYALDEKLSPSVREISWSDLLYLIALIEKAGTGIRRMIDDAWFHL
jgi:hypothetical protein